MTNCCYIPPGQDLSSQFTDRPAPRIRFPYIGCGGRLECACNKPFCGYKKHHKKGKGCGPCSNKKVYKKHCKYC